MEVAKAVERIPIMSPRSKGKVLAMRGQHGIWLWNKLRREWELITWEMLDVEVKQDISLQKAS